MSCRLVPSPLFSKLCHDSLHLGPRGLVPTTLGVHHHLHHHVHHHRLPCLLFALALALAWARRLLRSWVVSWHVMVPFGFSSVSLLCSRRGMAVYDQKHIYPSPQATDGAAGSRRWSYFSGICWQASHLRAFPFPSLVTLVSLHLGSRHGQPNYKTVMGQST